MEKAKSMLVSVLAFIIIMSLVVLVHEFGHFLAARRAGVPVYEFSVGFPFSPCIATLYRHQETEFTLRLLPLGGFVSFSADGDEDAHKLFGASRLSRASIMAGGPLFQCGFRLSDAYSGFYGKRRRVVAAGDAVERKCCLDGCCRDLLHARSTFHRSGRHGKPFRSSRDSRDGRPGGERGSAGSAFFYRYSQSQPRNHEPVAVSRTRRRSARDGADRGPA